MDKRSNNQCALETMVTLVKLKEENLSTPNTSQIFLLTYIYDGSVIIFHNLYDIFYMYTIDKKFIRLYPR